MPEIKHNFLRGKMNKDHDERLVGNGEYRDAMNIQVSSSDGSDVGAVQNILGNRHIGQVWWMDNIQSSAIPYSCIGGIADEKNNKLYYFLTGEDWEWENSFEDVDDVWVVGQAGVQTVGGWTINYEPGGPNGFALGDNQISGNIGQSSWMKYAGLDIVEGKTYRLSYDVVTSSLNPSNDPTTKPQLRLVVGVDAITTGSLSTSSFFHSNPVNPPLDVEATPGRYSLIWTQGAYNVGGLEFFSDINFTGTIANLKVELLVNNYILEYDTTKDHTTPATDNPTVTPVFVDLHGGVLKFKNYNRITGINIIDDMLYWTDGGSEPKRINIPRSIKGTNPNGEEPTNIINEARGISVSEDFPYGSMVANESHITVIKKAPTTSLLVNKESTRSKFKQYSADMEISLGDEIENDILNSSKGIVHDFTYLKAGDTFRTKLRTPLGQSDAVLLDWKVGNEVVLKEYPIASDGPLTEYRIKGTISNWSGNVFQTNNSIINRNINIAQGSQGIPTDWHWYGFDL